MDLCGLSIWKHSGLYSFYMRKWFTHQTATGITGIRGTPGWLLSRDAHQRPQWQNDP